MSKEGPNQSEKVVTGLGGQSTPKETLKVIEENISALKQKVANAQWDKEEYIRKKIIDLETLTQKGDEVAHLQQVAEDTLESLAPLREQEELKNDVELQKQIRATEALIAQLGKQAQEIFVEIGKIGKESVVTDRIYTEDVEKKEALKAQKEREITEKESEKKLESELTKDVNNFVQKIAELFEKQNAWYLDRDKLNEEKMEASKKIESFNEQALKMFDHLEYYKVSRILSEILDYIKGNSLEDPFTKLTELRKSFGLFSGGGAKKALDFMLAKRADLDDWKKAYSVANTKNKADEEFDSKLNQERSLLVSELKYMNKKYGDSKTWALIDSALSNLSKSRGKGYVRFKEWSDISYKARL